MPLAGVIVDDEADLARIRDGWDALAVAAGRPYCSPAWMLAWWRNARPEGAGLRVVAAAEGDRLLGVMPLWTSAAGGARLPRYEMLTSKLSPPVGPLIAPGREREVVEAMARALGSARPRPALLRFWSEGDEDPANGIAGAWPGGRPWTEADPRVAEPIVSLEDPDFEAWLAARSGHFRRDARRCRRHLDEQGAEFGTTAPEEMDAVIARFIDLHMTRWADPAESGLSIPGLREMLVEAAAEMAPSGRLRIFTIKLGGEVVAANLYVVAGTQVNAWNSGFEPRLARHSPAMLLDMHALEDALGRGETRLSLGPGGTGYKPRFANAEKRIAGLALAPRGATYPLARLQLARPRAQRAVKARLSELSRRLRARRTGRADAGSAATPDRPPAGRGRR